MRALFAWYLAIALTVLSFPAQPASAQAVPNSNFTSPASTPLSCTDLTQATNGSFIFTGSTGAIDVLGYYKGNWYPIAVTDNQGNAYSNPFTPTSNALYTLPTTGYSTIEVAPDATFSGDMTGSLSCQSAVLPVNVNLSSTPPFTLSYTTGSPLPVGCVTGCGSPIPTLQPELSTTSPLPVISSLPVIGQSYWWNGTGWVAVSASNPFPVSTPAPCASNFAGVCQVQPTAMPTINVTCAAYPCNFPTPPPSVIVNCAAAVNCLNAPTPQATVFVANAASFPTTAPAPTDANGKVVVETPAPQATVFVANTASFPTSAPAPTGVNGGIITDSKVITWNDAFTGSGNGAIQNLSGQNTCEGTLTSTGITSASVSLINPLAGGAAIYSIAGAFPSGNTYTGPVTLVRPIQNPGNGAIAEIRTNVVWTSGTSLTVTWYCSQAQANVETITNTPVPTLSPYPAGTTIPTSAPAAPTIGFSYYWTGTTWMPQPSPPPWIFDGNGYGYVDVGNTVNAFVTNAAPLITPFPTFSVAPSAVPVLSMPHGVYAAPPSPQPTGSPCNVCGTTPATPVPGTVQSAVGDWAGNPFVHLFALDPCADPSQPKTSFTLSFNSTASKQVVAPGGSYYVHYCHLIVTQASGTAMTFSIIEGGSGSTCAGGTTVWEQYVLNGIVIGPGADFLPNTGVAGESCVAAGTATQTYVSGTYIVEKY